MRLSHLVSLVLAVACLLAVRPSMAAEALPTASAAVSPRALDLARRYVAAMHMDRTMQAMMSTVMPAMMDQVMTGGAAKLPPEMQTEFRKIASEVMTDSMTRMVPKLVERLPQIYAETYSEAELEDIVRFYESASGQSALAKSPTIATRIMPIVAEMMPSVQADMLARLCARYPATCAAGDGRKAHPSAKPS
ncbi:hypothetical protein BH11PSE1_BH11PSE1_31440 [soil metagenome]